MLVLLLPLLCAAVQPTAMTLPHRFSPALLKNMLPVKQALVVGDDTADIQKMLNNVSTNGGFVQLQARRYVVNATLIVPDNVVLQGYGFSTILYQPHSCLSSLIQLGRASGLRDLQLEQEQPLPSSSGWQPYQDYDYQVRVQHDQATLENIMLLNPFKGIAIEPPASDGAVGQVQLFNIRGQPLFRGIFINHALDVIHIQQVHFWPFWAWNDNVASWMHEASVAIESVRNDNPIFSQLFLFGFNTGFQFSKPTGGGSSDGITSKPKISEYDCDFCDNGVVVQGDGVRGLTISQFSYQAPGDGNGCGVLFSGNDVTASISQADLSMCGANAVRVDGSSSFVTVTGSLIRSWNLSGKGFPCFEASGPGSKIIVDTTFYGSGQGAPASGTNVMFGSTVLNAAV